MNKRTLYKLTKSFVTDYKLDSSFVGKNVVIYDDRYSHIDKHKSEFTDLESFNDALNHLESIISHPDFITKDQKNNSLQFIKVLKNNVLVAVRISTSKELKIKTLYPISDTKLKRLKKEL